MLSFFCNLNYLSCFFRRGVTAHADSPGSSVNPIAEPEAVHHVAYTQRRTAAVTGRCGASCQPRLPAALKIIRVELG